MENQQNFDRRAHWLLAIGISLLVCAPLLADTPPQRVVLERSFGEFGFNDGQFNTPGRLCAFQHSVLVTDTQNHRVQRFLESGTYEYSFKTIQDDDGQPTTMDTPYGIAADALRGIFVTDIGSASVMEFDVYGAYQKTIGTFGGIGVKFNEPVAIAIDLQGFLYIVDRKNQKISKLDTTGAQVLQIPQREGDLSFPTDIWISPDGRIWILDQQGIKEYDELGKYRRMILAISGASAFAVDRQKRVYIALPESHSIAVVSQNGTLIQLISEGLKRPEGVCVLESRLFVSDAARHRVMVFGIGEGGQ